VFAFQLRNPIHNGHALLMKVHVHTYTCSYPHLNLLATEYWFCMSIIIKCCELHAHVHVHVHVHVV
jgi:hypothetical protein